MAWITRNARLLIALLFCCMSLAALVLSAERGTYTNPDTVAFSFQFKTGIVGDSWSQKSPFGADIRIGRGCASIEEIKQMVRDSNHIRIQTVYIVAGVANTACHDISIEDTMAEMPELIELCRQKFSPRTIIAYDPQVMWELLEHPEYCAAPREEPVIFNSRKYYDIHINDLGYKKLKQSRPLSFNTP